MGCGPSSKPQVDGPSLDAPKEVPAVSLPPPSINKQEENVTTSINYSSAISPDEVSTKSSIKSTGIASTIESKRVDDDDEMLPIEKAKFLASNDSILLSESSKKLSLPSSPDTSPSLPQAKMQHVMGGMQTPFKIAKALSGKSLLQLDRTSKFAAFNVRSRLQRTQSSSSGNKPFLRKLSERNLTAEQSTHMIGNLRNTLQRLNTIKTPLQQPQLLRLDSTGNFQWCCKCNSQHIKGLMCENQHFTCIDCFKPLVEAICRDTKILKGEKFSVRCSQPDCDSKEWNTFHVRKVLDGPTLELYIDTLVSVCRDDELQASSARDTLSTAAVFTGGEKYQHETMEMLRAQIRKLGLVPMEYIPLDEIREELQKIFDKLNNDEPYDEKRMDFLLMCMENNPVYIAEKEAEIKQWREEMATFTSECLDTMRGYIPPHIFEATIDSLQTEDGLPKDLAKRIMTKKCLWLTRMNILDIERIHEVELMGRFNPVAQQLDIVELAAIYACIPEKFLNDPSGRKAEWKTNVENSLKDMDKLRQSGSLLGSKARNMAYTRMKTPAPFTNRKTVRTMEVIQGLDE